jgi:uncharacterized protein
MGLNTDIPAPGFLASELIALVLPYATTRARASKIHGLAHWQRVGDFGAQVCRETPGADAHVVALFSALHDARRLNDGYDPDHGRRAADLAVNLQGEGVIQATETQMHLLLWALAEHAAGGVSDDPTVGCCWDADRLDLPRCGIQPDPALLSTKAGRRSLGRLSPGPIP